MITIDPPLVPARRLGRILSDRRAELGLSVQQISGRLDNHLTPAILDDVEHGRRDLSDAELVQVAGAYGVDVQRILPSRSELLIDLDTGTISVGKELTRAGSDPAQVLERYLGLVHSLRGASVGSDVPLRDNDVDVLAEALELSVDETFARLVELQLQPEQIASLARRLKRRLIVPAAGIFVAAVGLGSLIMVSGSQETPSSDGATITAGASRVSAPEVELIPPVVIERATIGGEVTTQQLGN
jgi:transcriptional regulator with XRE-family HTH domain